MDTKDIIAMQSTRPEKPRSQAEVRARYELDCQQYKDLKASSSDDAREQLLMIYAELKALGWALGKSEQDTIRDANY